MDVGISRFKDVLSRRKLTLVAPEGHEASKEEIEQIEAAFRQEIEDNSDIVKLVGIYHQPKGRLALDVFAVGSEAVLHENVSRWSSMMYPDAERAPIGHQWSIDCPKNVTEIVVQ